MVSIPIRMCDKLVSGSRVFYCDIRSAIPVEIEKPVERETEKQIKRSFFDRYVDKIKDFLDNAE